MKIKHDENAEFQILGKILFDCQKCSFIFSILDPEDFYLLKHREIYEAISASHAAGETVDISTIYLKPKMAQHVQYFADMAVATGSTAGIEDFATVIKELRVKRSVNEFASLLIEKIDEKTKDDLKTDIEEFAMGMHKVSGERGIKSMEEVMQLANETHEEIRAGNSRILSTGFQGLDSFIYGWEPGKMYVLGARPAVGKSALMLDFAKKCKGRAVIFSTEMDMGELADRFISAASGLPVRNFKFPEGLNRNRDTINSAMKQVSTYPIWIDDSPMKTVEQIVSDIRYMQIKNGVDIVFVDYLQYLQVPEHKKGRRLEEVNHISTSLKAAAKTLQVPIVTLASLHRFEGQVERRPRREDLRESGQIESDAHCVLLMYRDPACKADDPEEMELIVGKQRNGIEDFVRLMFHKSICSFTEA